MGAQPTDPEEEESRKNHDGLRLSERLSAPVAETIHGYSSNHHVKDAHKIRFPSSVAPLPIKEVDASRHARRQQPGVERRRQGDFGGSFFDSHSRLELRPGLTA